MITIRNRCKSFIVNQNSISNRTFLHAHQIVSFPPCLAPARAGRPSASLPQARCIPPAAVAVPQAKEANRHIPLLEFAATPSKHRALLFSNRHTSALLFRGGPPWRMAFFLWPALHHLAPSRTLPAPKGFSSSTSPTPFASDIPDRDCHPELVEGLCFLCLPSFPPSWYFLRGRSEKGEVQST